MSVVRMSEEHRVAASLEACEAERDEMRELLDRILARRSAWESRETERTADEPANDVDPCSEATAYAREFWSQDDLGRDFCVAITYSDDEAMAVWGALRRARAYVEERTHEEHRYKGRFLRSWSEDEGTLWPSDLEAQGIVP